MKDYPGTQFHGPFETHLVSVDGYQVPKVTVMPLKDVNDGSVNVILDRRFCVCADPDEARKWLPLIAHALAIGAGFTCHGANSERANPHKVQLLEIGEIET